MQWDEERLFLDHLGEYRKGLPSQLTFNHFGVEETAFGWRFFSSEPSKNLYSKLQKFHGLCKNTRSVMPLRPDTFPGTINQQVFQDVQTNSKGKGPCPKWTHLYPPTGFATCTHHCSASYDARPYTTGQRGIDMKQVQTSSISWQRISPLCHKFRKMAYMQLQMYVHICVFFPILFQKRLWGWNHSKYCIKKLYCLELGNKYCISSCWKTGVIASQCLKSLWHLWRYVLGLSLKVLRPQL